MTSCIASEYYIDGQNLILYRPPRQKQPLMTQNNVPEGTKAILDKKATNDNQKQWIQKFCKKMSRKHKSLRIINQKDGQKIILLENKLLYVLMDAQHLNEKHKIFWIRLQSKNDSLLQQTVFLTFLKSMLQTLFELTDTIYTRCGTYDFNPATRADIQKILNQQQEAMIPIDTKMKITRRYNKKTRKGDIQIAENDQGRNSVAESASEGHACGSKK